MTSSDIIDFFAANPNPTDDVIHAFAEKNKIDAHELEGLIYKTLTSLIQLKGYDVPDSKFDKDELETGIKVESEHTDYPLVAKAIAKAHLLEIPDYYTRLVKMEKDAESKSGKAERFVKKFKGSK